MFDSSSQFCRYISKKFYLGSRSYRCILGDYACITSNYTSCILPPAAEKSSWILCISPDTQLVAIIIVRGPFALNAVQLLPHRLHGSELADFAEKMTASIARADALNHINYASTVFNRVTILKRKNIYFLFSYK